MIEMVHFDFVDQKVSIFCFKDFQVLSPPSPLYSPPLFFF